MERSEDLLFSMRSLEVFIYLSVCPDPILALTRAMGWDPKEWTLTSLMIVLESFRKPALECCLVEMEGIQVCITCRHLERSSFKFVMVLTSQSYRSSTQ